MKIAVIALLLGACTPHGPSTAAAPRPAVTVVAPADAKDASASEPASDAGRDVTAADSQKLEMRWQSAWNLHYGGNRGAEHENSAGGVSVELAPGGSATVIDGGRREEGVLDGNRYSETTTEWRASWRGKWTLDKGTLRLNAARAEASCEVSESVRDGAQQYAPEKTACMAGSERLALECETRTVTVASANDPDGTSAPTPGWECRPHGSEPGPDWVGARFPWVFAGAGCIERSGGMPRSGPIRYAECEPSAGAQ